MTLDVPDPRCCRDHRRRLPGRPHSGRPGGQPGARGRRVGQAVALGAEVVVLPELVSSGYAFADSAEARAAAEAADGPTIRLWERLASDHDLVIVGGFCESSGNEVLNSAAIVDPTGLLAVYRKAHLWDRERLIFTAGDAAPPVVRTRIGQVSTLVCYDLEFPEWVRLPALEGAQSWPPPSTGRHTRVPKGSVPARSCASKPMQRSTGWRSSPATGSAPSATSHGSVARLSRMWTAGSARVAGRAKRARSSSPTST